MKSLPERYTCTMYVIYHTEEWRTDDQRISLWPFDTSRASDEDVLLGTVEVTFDVPQVDIVSNQVARLRQRREAVMAKATAEAAQIDRQIQELLALPAPDNE